MPGLGAHTSAYAHGEPWLAYTLAYLDRNRKALSRLVADQLPGVRYSEPEATYLALLDFRETGLGDDPAAILREEGGVALTSGPACGEAARGFARLNLGTPPPIMEEKGARMSTVIAEH